MKPRLPTSTSKIHTGLDDIRFDTRNFPADTAMIAAACDFFSIGDLRRHENEKNTAVSHSNFITWVTTSRGNYILKFYPAHARHDILREMTLNRLLTRRRFPTPRMHASRTHQAFIAVNGYLAVCFDFMAGTPACQQRLNDTTIRAVNHSILQLNLALTPNLQLPRILKNETFLEKIRALRQSPGFKKAIQNQPVIVASLEQSSATYAKDRSLFIPRPRHTNISLSNILLHNRMARILDLSHVHMDVEVVDLSSLVISCLFFHTPSSIITKLVRGYFKSQDMEHSKLAVLTTSIRLGLIKEYLKTDTQEHAHRVGAEKTSLLKAYRHQIKTRKALIVHCLKRVPQLCRL